jgi:opacity protein-like surface antigen
MKQKTKLKFLILTAAASLGLALSAAAQSATASVPESAPMPYWGLLGTSYTGVAFNYTQLDAGAPSAMRGADLTFNQPLSAGFDLNLGYDWGRASTGTARLTDQDLNLGLTAFTKLDWGRPYVQALAGWEWRRGSGFADDNSFAYTLGTGVEFQVAQPFVITPYINFVRATGFNRSEFDLGVKGTYRLTKEWSLTAGVQYDAVRRDKDAKEFTLGVNYQY